MHRLLIGLMRPSGLIPAILFLAVIGLVLVGCAGETETHEFAGAELPPQEAPPDFTLTAEGDRQVSLSDFRGQYVFIYFGYTFCPDFCPTTLAKLDGVQDAMGDDADNMQVIMVTVDPDRDTPDVLAHYVEVFNPTFLGLGGTLDEIDAAAEPFGVFYQRNEGSAAAGHLVDHSTRTYLIGPDGQPLVAYPHDATVEAIAADLRWLMASE